MFGTFVARMRSLIAGTRDRAQIEHEMHDEMRLHLEMRARDLERAGLSPALAREKTRRESGNLDEHKQRSRESRYLHWFDAIQFSMLDAKLGLRMLLRYPGLTTVGGIVIAFAIAIGCTTFEFIN